MYGYYKRKSNKSKIGQVQRRSRYQPTRPNLYQPGRTDATRTTAPLRDSPGDRQYTYFSNRNTRRVTSSLAPRQDVTRGTDPLLPRMSARVDYEDFPIEIQTPRSRRDMPFRYYFLELILGIWNLFQTTPPKIQFVCVILCISVLILLSLLVHALLQIIAPLETPIYIISGIIASVIVIYEFIFKR